MKKKLLVSTVLAFCLSLISNTSFAQIQDNVINDPGDIAFVAYTTGASNGVAGFAFVLLDNCPAGTTIYFTDEEWTGSNFASFYSVSEGDLSWQNNTGATIARGTVIKVAGPISSTVVAWTSGNTSVNLGAINIPTVGYDQSNGDQVYAMTASRPASGSFTGTFLAFVGGIGINLSFTSTPFGSGTSLTAYGKNITAGRVYTGSTTCNGTAAQCNTQVNTGSWSPASGWTTTAQFNDAIPNNFGGSVLPVELTQFDVNTEGSKNNLIWATASEKNNIHFEIERSTDGTTFHRIGQVKGNNKPSSYQFVDNQPFATSYYRLRQIDNDGTETLSKVISISTKSNVKLNVYPSVTSQFLTIETTEMGDYQIFNLMSQQVLNGKTEQQLDVSALPQGTYILKVGQEQAKFVKQ